MRIQPSNDNNATEGIPGQQRSYETLARSENRLRIAADASGVGVFEWDFVTGQSIFENARMFEIFGRDPAKGPYTRDEFVNEVLHPEDAPIFLQTMARCLTESADFHAVCRIRRDDGAVRWVSFDGTAEFTPDGKPARLVGVIADVTESFDKDAVLQRQAAIFEHQTDCIIVTDLAGHILDFNPACERMLGYSREEVLGKTTAIFHRPEEAATLTDNALGETEQVGEWRGEINFLRKDGSPGVCETVVKPLSDATGRVVGAVGVNRDITDRREAEAALRQHQAELEALNERLRRAMQETHHRVKNNLQVIAALAEMQAIGAGTIPASSLDRIGIHARSLAALHDALTNRPVVLGEPGSEWLGACDMMERLIPLLRGANPDRPLRHVCTDFPITTKQASALAQLCSELVANSVKHGRGTITLTLGLAESTGESDPGAKRPAGKTSGRPFLTVEDEGDGFPENFDPEASSSTGLELAVMLANYDLQGSIDFGDAPGGGAKVRVSFPLASGTALWPRIE